MRRTISTTMLLLALVLVPSALAEGGEGTLVDQKGAVSLLDDSVVAVSDGARTLTCRRTDRSPALAGVAVGDRLVVRCKRVEGAAVLVAWKRADEARQNSIKGRVAELTDTAIVVQGEGQRLACSIGDGSPQTARLRTGDRIAMLCKMLEDGLRLAAWKRIGEGEEMRVVDIAGSVHELTDESITIVNRERGRMLTCVVPERLLGLLEGLQVGDRAKMLCTKRFDGRRTLLKLRKRQAEEKPARTEAKPGSTEEKPRYVDIVGRVTGNEGGMITVTSPDTGRALACKAPADGEFAAVVSGLAVGTGVVMLCSDGVVVKVKRLEESSSGGSLSEFVYRGTVVSFSADRITVATDEGPRSCLVTDAFRAAVAERPVGQRVKMLCKGTDVEHAKLVAIASVD